MKTINLTLIQKIAGTLMLLLGVGCSEDFLETEPQEFISQEQLASNPESNQFVLNGIYAGLRTFDIGNSEGSHVDYGLMAVKNATDVMGHDITMPYLHWFGFYYNYDGRIQTSSRTRLIYVTFYKQIMAANTVINIIPPDTQDQEEKWLLGQALALRGNFYFYLARIYADSYLGHQSDLAVPIEHGDTLVGNPRATVEQVYAEITGNLESAVTLLEGYARSSKQELDQTVVYRMLARVYLEMGQWQMAADAANAAKAGYSLMEAEEWGVDGFSEIGNPEWMWGADIDNESTTVFASFFSHFDNLNDGYAGALGVYKGIDARLYGLIPDTDVRKAYFIGPQGEDPAYPDLPPYANIKFRDATFFEGDYVYMRASEMYLIEAEALARLGNPMASAVLFELVSNRDPGYSQSTSTGEALLEEIYLQRRIELWGEGFSWFDLKRLDKDMVRDYPGSNHGAFALFNVPSGDARFNFQLPEDEVNANDAIGPADQNP